MLTAVTNILFAFRWWLLPIVVLVMIMAALTVAARHRAEVARVATEQVQRNTNIELEQKAKEKESADQRLAEQRTAAQLMADKDRRAGLMSARSLPSKVDFVVAAATVAKVPMERFATSLVKHLRARGKTASNIVFSPVFVTEGAFDSFFAGQGSADLRDMPVSTMGNRLFFARISIDSVKPGTTAAELFTASVSVVFRILSADEGSVVDGFSINAVGAGTSETDATSAALDRVLEELGEHEIGK